MRLLAHRARGLLALGIAASLTLAVGLQWHAVETVDWGSCWLPFLGAAAIFSLGPLAGATSFWIILRDIAPTARFGPSVWVWGRSFAARYLPSGALTVAVRLVERERLGTSRARVLSVTAHEYAVAVAAAAAVSLAAFSIAGRTPPLLALVVLVGILGLLLPAQPLARWWSRRRGALPPADIVLIRAQALVPATGVSVCSWLTAGAAAWIFVAPLAPDAPPELAFLLGAYTFAWLVGFLVPFAPSGLGVREATLIALLAPVVGAGPATALSVGLRLANVAGDFVAIGAIEAVYLARRRCSAGTAHPVAVETS